MPRRDHVLSLFERSARALQLCVASLNAIHQGVWLGLFDNEKLQNVTNSYYEKRDFYRQSQYNNKGFFTWEEQSINAYFAECRHILVGAAGGGREVIALARSNYEVTAFECVPELVKAAENLIKTGNLSARIYYAEPNRVPDGLGKFDGMILGWGAYMHIQGRANRIQFLKELHQHLKEDAPLLLSFAIRDEETRFYSWVYHIARVIRYLRRADAPESGDTLPDSFDHYCTENELRAELEEANFEILHYLRTPYAHAVARSKK
jgi:2-polyprenyl-3-methyl-5-hydroxy-6-metoxy-1,4-benzoquinol methylase